MRECKRHKNCGNYPSQCGRCRQVSNSAPYDLFDPRSPWSTRKEASSPPE